MNFIRSHVFSDGICADFNQGFLKAVHATKQWPIVTGKDSYMIKGSVVTILFPPLPHIVIAFTNIRLEHFID